MKQLKALVEKINGKMIAVASDETEDRHGDIVKQDRWDLRSFRKNPVLLLSHNYSLPPIGIAKNLVVQGGKLTFEPHFHDITQDAREVAQMFDQGIMAAFSVGYIDHEDNNELLEISAVSVPANPNALVFAKSVDDSSPEDKEKIKGWLESEVKEAPQSSPDPAPAAATDKALAELLAEVKFINVRLNNIEKGRQGNGNASNEVLARSLEKLNKSLGFLNRKVK